MDMLKYILIAVIIIVMAIVFVKFDFKKLWPYKAGGDFKNGFSSTDYCLKGLKGEYKKLKNISFPDNLKFAAIDTVLVHKTGLYIFEYTDDVSSNKLKQYWVNIDILADYLKIDRNNCILIAICKNTKNSYKNDYNNLFISTPEKIKKMTEKFFNSREEIYTDKQTSDIYQQLIPFERKVRGKGDLRE
ncbi:MAG: hypothetical protein J1F01_00900 [Oscillospiraceae bacterium]|nr:hypothetical protein [Oscillospiraceae bacterium]